MRKTVFIVSHVGSGYEVLLHTLLKNNRIIPVTNCSLNNYSNLSDIINANSSRKFFDKATYFIDCVLYNHLFSAYDAFDICKFIYLIDEPTRTLPKLMIERKNLSLDNYKSHYLYRLRRICEMAKRTKHALFLTHNDLYMEETYKVIENYLNLNEKLEIPSKKVDYLSTDSIPQKVLNATESAYEKYLYFIKLQNLVFVN